MARKTALATMMVMIFTLGLVAVGGCYQPHRVTIDHNFFPEMTIFQIEREMTIGEVLKELDRQGFRGILSSDYDKSEKGHKNFDKTLRSLQGYNGKVCIFAADKIPTNANTAFVVFCSDENAMTDFILLIDGRYKFKKGTLLGAFPK